MKSLIISLFAVLAMAAPPAALTKPEKPQAPPVLTPRQKVLRVAGGEVGVQEKTGRNDGEVDKYLAAVGLGGSRAPYCAAFNFWVGKQALGSANPYPKSAWSPDHVVRGMRVTAATQVKGGEAFGIWFASKGRIAHTGLLERRDGDWLITIEANTSPTAAVGSAADRDGQGVYRKRRHWRTVHSTRDWLAPLDG